MTTPLIEAIARKLCINDDRNPDDPFFVNSPDGLRQWKGYEFDAMTALTAITEAGYEISPEWLPRDRLEAAHDMLRWARAALDDGYRTERAKQEIAKIDQYFAAISAAQGDG